MQLTFERKKMQLRHTWRISRGATNEKEYWFVALEDQEITGYGEAAHNTRYGEDLESIRAFLSEAQSVFAKADPMEFYEINRKIHRLADGQNAAKAALNMALLDWVGKKLRVPVYQLLGLSPKTKALSSYSIGIDSPEKVQELVQAASDYPILKIKLGGANDKETVRAIREVTDRTIRVDANEGWETGSEALEMIEWLAAKNVEFVEQPLPAGKFDEVGWLKRRSPLPIVADEDVLTARDIPKLAECYDGINIKLMKAGGILEAKHMIETARLFDLKIMLGCMVESSLGITAAAQLAPLVDWLDLDGNLLIKNDPFKGAFMAKGRIAPPAKKGLGVERK